MKQQMARQTDEDKAWIKQETRAAQLDSGPISQAGRADVSPEPPWRRGVPPHAAAVGYGRRISNELI